MLHSNIFTQYEALCEAILSFGEMRPNRTGTDAVSTFGATMRFDLARGFPLIFTKAMPYKLIVGELLWFLEGSTNTNRLKALGGGNIWDEWADEKGDLGPIYGHQWRNFGARTAGTQQYYPGVDQIDNLIETLRTNPLSRRMLVSAWNPLQNKDMALEPCHVMFQCYAHLGRLSMSVYQRSADMFLGVPFNIASYATLVHMLAHITGMKPGTLIWNGGDCHIYRNHIDQVETLIERAKENEEREQSPIKRFPKLMPFDSVITEIDHFQPKDFVLTGYHPYPAIKGEVAK